VTKKTPHKQTRSTVKQTAPGAQPAQSGAGPSGSGALRFLRDRYIGNNSERIASYEAALANAEVARDIYRLRASAELTQAQLARLVGTTASVICRLEDAEYEGHSLSMLRRIAAALGKRVEVRFVDVEKPPKPRATKRTEPS
jgi:DNA-binding XRE family transcriptional regulator